MRLPISRPTVLAAELTAFSSGLAFFRLEEVVFLRVVGLRL